MPVCVFSNHDSRRSIRRLGNDPARAKLLQLLQLTVRGVPCIYYGEEIGMTDGHIARRQAQDPIPHEFGLVPEFVFDLHGITINRDRVRTPMQWDSSTNAGFSQSARTWLPVNPDHAAVNVAAETGKPDSLLSAIRAASLADGGPALHAGSLQLLDGLPDGILGYVRRSDTDELAVFLNFSSSPVTIGPRWRAMECRFQALRSRCVR